MKYSIVFPLADASLNWPYARALVIIRGSDIRRIAWTSDFEEAVSLNIQAGGLVVDTSKFSKLYKLGKPFRDCAKLSKVPTSGVTDAS